MQEALPLQEEQEALAGAVIAPKKVIFRILAGRVKTKIFPTNPNAPFKSRNYIFTRSRTAKSAGV